ncbi:MULTISPECIES: hypothetical protein [Streptomyces]|uniref:hypothetical protein n=1 Tax=Streptomyces TaxID=1883 RepID=UPI00163B89DF|nr:MULTISPECIES: hypothetical protein [Streptomyces]MBC2874223.1 hypothetical protein [Streptomyces sp. TYQ1024]UBI40263.1 hypothetical protein K7I03_29970 [Streptomyces mobaraensis]UKW32841.1 hypothetical protein MCU78_29895 [Streptomyces sp. TYQ1024]
MEVLTFRVHKNDLDSMKKAIVTDMSPADAEAFMDRYSRLYGAGEPHDYQYIRGFTGLGREHYFNKSVFHLLNFVS